MLAEKLGMTAREVTRRMDYAEFAEWVALAGVEAREREIYAKAKDSESAGNILNWQRHKARVRLGLEE